MSRLPRVAALLAVLALPLCAVLVSLLPIREAEPPRVPDTVRIGESAPPSVQPSPHPTPPSVTTTPPGEEPDESTLPPPPPVDDDEFDDSGDAPDDADSVDDG